MPLHHRNSEAVKRQRCCSIAAANWQRGSAATASQWRISEEVSSIIVVDSPAETGYSYADTTDYTTNDTRTVSDLYEFVIKWFSEYPEFLPNPFYLAGCSYSGVLVPVLAQEVVKGIESDKGPKLNFKGYSLGNAAMNLDIESSSKVPFAHRMGLIPDEQDEDLVYSCEGKYFGNSDPDCLRNLEIFQWHIKDINKDHILCLPCHFTMGNNMVAYKYDSFRTYESIHGETQCSPYCHVSNFFNTFMWLYDVWSMKWPQKDFSTRKLQGRFYMLCQ
ncbi:hypothetical protein C4D60_Mb11t08860 [Musa balbisiana]|uniref:Serine carboxypeptidase-like 19 n=1 Tax=Musa balbisiana TaxID=52838 RepID=A0A4V4H5E0_MUSBA|nr:hypothetical protein C4D60_Mb11t08860 [Musa balbisiana]